MTLGDVVGGARGLLGAGAGIVGGFGGAAWCGVWCVMKNTMTTTIARPNMSTRATTERRTRLNGL